MERPIPLQYYLYTGSRVYSGIKGIRQGNTNIGKKGSTSLEGITADMQKIRIPSRGQDTREYLVPIYDSKSKKVAQENLFEVMRHFSRRAKNKASVDGQADNEVKEKLSVLIEHLNDQGKLPAILFMLSRVRITEYARYLTKLDLVSSKEDKNKIFFAFQTALSRVPSEDIQELESISFCRDLALRGIGVHHSGLIVPIKEVYEKLMQARPPLIRVLLATETVACGVDTPTKTVVFTDVSKPDGIKRRLLHGTEAMQMAGRAGRRGYDDEGHVVFSGFNPPKVHDIMNVIQKPSEPIKSRFKLRDQLVLSLLMQRSKVSIEDLLRRSLCEGPKAHFWDLIKRIKHHINHTDTLDPVLLEVIQLRQRIKAINDKIADQLWSHIRPQLKPGQRIWYLEDTWIGAKASKQELVKKEQHQGIDCNSVSKRITSAFKDRLKSNGDRNDLHLETSSDALGEFQENGNREKANAEMDLMTGGKSSEKRNLSSLLMPKKAFIMHAGVGQAWLKVCDDDVTRSTQVVHKSSIVHIENLNMKTRNLKLDVLVLEQERKVLVDLLLKFEATMRHRQGRIVDVFRCEDRYYLTDVLEELRYRLSDQALYLMPLYEERLMTLTRLGFLTSEKQVTNIGVCAAQIISCDSIVLLTWLNSDLYPRDAVAFATVASSLVYPGWKRHEAKLEAYDNVRYGWKTPEIQSSLNALLQISKDIRGSNDEDYTPNPRMMPAVYTWASGESFSHAASLSPEFEGNFVQVLQRLSELVRQLYDCLAILGDRFEDLPQILEEVHSRIRRGIVTYESIYLI
mmetsp:Transcript_7302/g.10200  ORF Transcript_7302/g.10200 Transcript_7302/m.10200 type:complete len:796 (+) Transcript_7302:205-2592(+)